MEENKRDTSAEKSRGMSLRLMNVLLIAVAIIVSVVLFYDIFRTAQSYSEFRTATERYLSFERDVTALKAGSDYLTEQVRLFAVTGERQYLDNYFTEARETKSRDKAYESFKTYLDGTEEYEYLKEALDYSNKLMEQEYASMKLRALSSDDEELEMSSLPPEVVNAELGALDLGLDADAQKERSIELVFSKRYRDIKDKINDDIANSIDKLAETNAEDQNARTNELLANLRVQTALIVVAFLVILGMMIMTSRFVIAPMTRAQKFILADEKIPVKGSKEMRVLAETYNHMYESNAQKRMELSFAANHDGLTGLYNRAAYLRAIEQADWEDVAVLAIDIDAFKQINDTYGHAAGDAVLVAVAKALVTVFRSDDFVCRLGGDEFTVIMKNTGDHLRGLIRSKVDRAMDMIRESSGDGVPGASISVGVSFGVWKDEAVKIANRADIALYQVKKGGKNGCAFFDEIESKND